MQLPEYAELDAFRLAKNWTWDELADEMARLDVPMSARTLHYLIKRAPEDARPLDRTIYKIRLFLKRTATARRRAQERVKG